MIIVKLQGGLGNQLFQYVFGLKWAKYYDTALKIELSWFKHTPSNQVSRPYVLNCFNLDVTEATEIDFQELRIPLIQRDAVWAKLWNRSVNAVHPCCIKQKGLTDLYQAKPISNNSYLQGNWIAKYAYSELKIDLQHMLTLKADYLFPSECLQHIENNNSVCIHIRRGDYLLSNKFLLSLSYYHRGILKLKTLVTTSPHFYIFSDDISWCKTTLTDFLGRESINATFIDDAIPCGKNDLYHFHLMSSCKHFIIANSTFSWWAACLGTHPDKIVICPAQFEGSNTQHPHLILADWIPLANH